MRSVPATIVGVERQLILHNLSVFFVALGIHNAMRMRHIVFCGLHDFSEKKKDVLMIKRVLIFSTTFV